MTPRPLPAPGGASEAAADLRTGNGTPGGSRSLLGAAEARDGAKAVRASTPQRIQRRRVRGWRAPKHSTYVGRPTRFGNPFAVVPAASRRGGPLDMWAVRYQGRNLGRWDDKTAACMDATDRYARWIREPEQADMRTLFRALLHGRDLSCWCPLDQACHADVLLRLVNGPEAGESQ